eukprot:3294113-Pleurochrysis_carterae.AAC.5
MAFLPRCHLALHLSVSSFWVLRNSSGRLPVQAVTTTFELRPHSPLCETLVLEQAHSLVPPASPAQQGVRAEQ